MKKCIRFILLAWIMILLSCSDDDKLITYCIDFDMRQCEGNPWLKDNQVPSSIDEHLALITDYFNNAGINILHGEIDNSFHSIVCQACYICPAGPRFRIGVMARDTSAVYDLELLNISTIDCPDEF